MRRNVLLIVIFVGLLLPGTSYPQILPESADSSKGDVQTAPPSQPHRSNLKPKKSPMGALMRSALVPGWGQFYNRKLFKSALVCGVESFFVIKAVHWWSKTENQYKTSQSVTDLPDKAMEFNKYLTYRGNRDDYLWAVGVTIFLSMFDAYVDAHLAGFDVDLTPDFEAPKESLSIKLTLKF